MPSALQERRTASTPPAGLRPPPACARLRGRLRRPGSLLCPAPAQAGDDYDALILRARAATTNRRWPCCAPWVGRRPARHPGPHPGGQLGGRPDEVTQTYAQLPAGAQPPDVRLAVARALRDARWPEALAQFRAGMRAYPSQPAFAAGIAMTLADADHPPQEYAV